ncbi:hypothetical protein ACE01N_02545 [Saccharicrinis sp. FJH2]|uniref:hypothetical protein n=1 Tax=Saccharicrinis sp. FJH65 TaxID=3344659 RepID=UPI0035F32B9D
MRPSESDAIKLLWTGGWDSTYRLCEILILLKRNVQPIYLIDEGRYSTREELQAQAEIKLKLGQKFPYIKDLLLPTRFYTVSDIKISPEIHKNYTAVRNIIGLGYQYQWLAGFCEQYNISHLELGFEWTLGSSKHEFLSKYVIKRNDVDYESYILDPIHEKDAAYNLLRFYDWPIWLKTRDNMVEISQKFNFYDILHLSWFCHKPINGKPCGRCNPCKDVIHYGFKYRLGQRALIRYRLRNISLSSVKNVLHRYISNNN